MPILLENSTVPMPNWTKLIVHNTYKHKKSATEAALLNELQ